MVVFKNIVWKMIVFEKDRFYKTSCFVNDYPSLTIVNDYTSLTIVNDDPSLTIVNEERKPTCTYHWVYQEYQEVLNPPQLFHFM